MNFDIFNPQVSRIASGLEGKIITVYGSNSTGKTKQLTQLPKPFYLPFEGGLGAINGISFLPINTWGDFKKINRQLTNPKNLEKAKETIQTIIFDEIWASSKFCQQYICEKYEADSIKSGNGGYGLWSEYETEMFNEINKLISAGYTVCFIGHTTADEDGKVSPKGDKRALGPIIDNSDIVIYLKSNGVDENGKVIKSSAYLAETDQYFARSRFDLIVPYLQEFTAKNLEKAIDDAIKAQEKADGVKAVSAIERQSMFKSEEIGFEELVNEIKAAGQFIYENGRNNETVRVIEQHLGKGLKVSDATEAQKQDLSVILQELNQIIASIKEEKE
ncbi:ATP-binding protein [Paenibacillus sp. GCM10027627]|uniref:ATP-binding protein n=1 Tax=unclassified Paenibacillus TaxID=185978 RepID=UPI0036433570